MKTVIVTGGGRGIGKAITKKLLKEKCYVNILDSNSSYLNNLMEELKNEGMKGFKTFLCDVGNPDEVRSIMEKIQSGGQQIDSLINNAGISKFEPIDSMSVEAWNRILYQQILVVFFITTDRQT
jgi:gluconate 5-dehydrogenase